ncbi:zinc-dependent alcohol dehydrogenase family protein [Marinobacterium mangrovicola]|uniref:NADPH:quinone reductase-like Zn-dependent oxidoreductase n=1 Tax=Marinobacterium mangrovicola TaxID=1476959 RepID=A0A4R1GLW4_9GAMM|nr:NAD(P)-dependent alcohol dehydrogenase [Marinobacterium mangrovicola]TCK09544.1 NADPH:quinone reductase-like Zn-dependent oxidoreductase [Marinobacterium mangrovicola]
MKSWRSSETIQIDSLRLTEEPRTSPQRGEVLIRVRAVSLNFRDVAMLSGRYPQPYQPGLIPCSDGAGEVVEVGEGVDELQPGDRVMGLFHLRWFEGPIPQDIGQSAYGSQIDGWLCEYKVISRESIVPIPNHLSFEQAATLPCAATTAWNALNGLTPTMIGDTVLVQGSGGVSLFALQLAKALGARVIATTSQTDKERRLKALGADEVINYRQEPEWGVKAKKLTGGLGVDRVIEVGGANTFNQSIKAIKLGGKIDSIGFLSGQSDEGIDFYQLFATRAELRMIQVGNRALVKTLCQAMAARQIEPVIDRVFAFEDARAAFHHLDSGHHFGKTVIRC